MNGRFAITCDYEKGLQKAGEGDGVAQLSEDHQADKDFVVNCPILLPDGTPNTSDALSSMIPNPAGLFSYQQVKLSALTPRFSPASASAAAPVACPQCTGQTLIRVVLVADLTGTFPWYYSLSTWTQRAGAGPDSGAMWDTFRTNLAAHEAGHLAIFRSDYVAPVTAASNVFVKTACIGEVCFDPNASNGQTQAYNKARNLANAQLALVRATWNAPLSAAWSTHGTKQAAYDTTTQHGGTQSVVGGADVFTVLGLNLNE